MTRAMMKAVQVAAPGAPMEMVEIEVPIPGDGQVLLKVEACGVCHGDAKVLEGAAASYPRIPGHEVVGIVCAKGRGVTRWNIGERVGIGWHAGHGETTALTTDGGYAEYMVAYEDGLVSIPKAMAPAEAAPLLCAGETTFSAIRNSGARLGDLVAISGIGGLGHLAIQYAAKAGCEVAAISRGGDKEDLARKLGASHYIDSNNENAAEALQRLGGAQLIVATAPSPDAIRPLIGGLAKGGELVIAAVDEKNIGWSAMDFLNCPGSVKGTFTDLGEVDAAIRFSVLTGVRPIVETYPLERAQEAFDSMMLAKARFRAVLVMEGR